MSEYVIAQKQDLINIANAIREKAETTDGIGVDEMAALIAAIESGGGGWKSGTITCAENTIVKGYILEHNLGVPPLGLFIWKNPGGNERYELKVIAGIRTDVSNTIECTVWYLSGSYYNTIAAGNTNIYEEDINGSTIILNSPLSEMFFTAGKTYSFIVVG